MVFMIFYFIIFEATAAIQPLFLEGSQVMDNQHKRIALFYNVTTPQDLQILKPEEIEADNMVISFQGEWQVGPTSRLHIIIHNISYNIGYLSCYSQKFLVN